MATDCIEWNRAKTPAGYGIVWKNQKLQYIHRVAFEEANNIKLNKNQFVCHKCDNPSCYNSEHLFLGDAKINYLDMVSKNRDAKEFMLPHTKLSNKDISDILEMRKNGVRVKDIASKYNVHQSHISKICSRTRRKVLG